jgi:hypothetical protein
MKTLLLIAGLMLFAAPAAAQPTMELIFDNGHSIVDKSGYILANVRISNPDDVDYNRVAFKCQLFDKDGHAFYSTKTLDGAMVPYVRAHDIFREQHRFVGWGKEAVRAECKTTWTELATQAAQRFAPDRHREYDHWEDFH